MRLSRLPALLLLCSAAFFAAEAAFAEGYNVGDACTAAGTMHTKNDASGTYQLICNGTAWVLSTAFEISGEVGIGTTTPGSALHVNGITRSTEYNFTNSTTSGFAFAGGGIGVAVSGTNIFGIYNGYMQGTSGAGSPRINRGVGTAANPAYTFHTWADTGMYAPADDTIAFTTGGTERARINSSGNVGIGTTTPAATLDVVGDIQYTGLLTDTSDRRMKENITPLPLGQLASVVRLQPVSFTMKGDDETELGLIAQDVEGLYPDLVKTMPNGTKSLNYLGLIAPLIGAIQEQQQEIDALKARLDALEGRRLTSNPYND